MNTKSFIKSLIKINTVVSFVFYIIFSFAGREFDCWNWSSDARIGYSIIMSAQFLISLFAYLDNHEKE